MYILGLLLVAATSVLQLVTAISYEPLLAPSYPLAVRSPYLSAWLPGANASHMPSAIPYFWAGQELNLGIMARANNTTYSLFSIADSPKGAKEATVTDVSYTATHTIFTLSSDSLTFSLDFFSPVSPKNYIRQSFPFSYFTVSVQGAQGDVQFYTDFDETWTGQNQTTISTFNRKTVCQFADAKDISAFQLSVDGAATYGENADMALWGSAVLGASTINATVSTETGPLADVRSAFASNGSLSDQNDPYKHGDVVAIVQTPTGSNNGSATFAVGYVRGDKTINYNGQARAGYYMSKYTDTTSALSAFFADYNDANAESTDVDSSIIDMGTKAGGANYSDILALSLRQTYGALDLTIPSNNLSNTEDFMIFLKEISSDGNMNTLDVLFPTMPVWYVMSPEYIRYTLEPVMQYLETGVWQQPYAIHDIGQAYPNATGYPNNTASELMPIEESGNINILAYAYTKATGDHSFANKYRGLFQQYADYLASNGLIIAEQLSTDDGAGPLPNQTNLAIKAAIGLNAFGQMFNLANYSDIGRNFSHQLYEEGLGTDPNRTHFTLQYGNDTTYTTAFNLYPDLLLNLSTFNPEVFAMQSKFYPNKRADTGVPLDNRVAWMKSDWALYCAAYSTEDATKNMFIDDVHSFISENQPYNQVPFSDKYFVSAEFGDVTGTYDGYKNRPVVGGHFAIVALQG